MGGLGIAIAKRTGERRLLTIEEYLALDRISEARWEFYSLPLDPETGEPDSAKLEEEGFTPGGPTVLPGDAVEVDQGIFQSRDANDLSPPVHWFEKEQPDA